MPRPFGMTSELLRGVEDARIHAGAIEKARCAAVLLMTDG